MTADMGAVEEPIYDVAIECEKLFENQIARFTQAGEGNGEALLTELSQQFSTWANSMKVFVDGDLSLDRKLQGHAEIQDQVLRGLDLMRANLAYGEPLTPCYTPSLVSQDFQLTCAMCRLKERMPRTQERLSLFV